MSNSTPNGDEAISVERRPPDDIFGLLGNDIRVRILEELGQAPDSAHSFSELFDRIDLADSGNFNYHLDKLCGSFIRKTDGYELTYAGKQIIGAIHAGTYTADVTIDPVPISWTCLLCDGDMVAEYRDGTAIIRCADCRKGADFAFPPGSLDQFTRAELPHVFSRWWHHSVKRITDGFCPTCAGRLEGELVRPPGGDSDDPQPSMTEFNCRRCRTRLHISGATLATSHPIVEGFLAEHGFETSDHHPSQVWKELGSSEVHTLSEDPLRIEVRFTYDHEIVTAEIGPDATITDVQRNAVPDGE